MKYPPLKSTPKLHTTRTRGTTRPKEHMGIGSPHPPPPPKTIHPSRGPSPSHLYTPTPPTETRPRPYMDYALDVACPT